MCIIEQHRAEEMSVSKTSPTIRKLRENAKKGAHWPKVTVVSSKPRVYRAACRDCDWQGQPGTGNHAYAEMEAHSEATLSTGPTASMARLRVAEPSAARLRRIQIHMDRTLDDAAEAEARRRGISKAKLIRQALARELGAANRRHADPWQAMVGWLDDDPLDDIDAVIYDPKP